MKLKVKRRFRYQVTATEVAEVDPGVYSVPGDISAELADKIRRFGKAEIVVEKKAPENKVRGKAPESKAKVSKRGRRRTRSKSDG